MIGNSTLERGYLEMTYEDTATVLRGEAQVGEDKITRTETVILHSEIICALSKSGSDKSRESAAINTIEYDALIFISPELSICAGDRVELKRFGRNDKATKIILELEVVGRPSIYSTHQEVKVKERVLA